ncbi:hypothetical protein ACHAXR_012254 [Thalassiosira sp. AJA248-18]
MNVAKVLKRSRRSIEADRLLAKLFATSRLVHGADHEITKKVEQLQKLCKTRIVVVTPRWRDGRFEALRYVDNGKRCIIKGPIGERFDSRDEDKEQTTTVDAGHLSYDPQGTPVVCHGLKNASHLNGKIGDIRSLNERNGRYVVYFEDMSITPPKAEVKLIFVSSLICPRRLRVKQGDENFVAAYIDQHPALVFLCTGSAWCVYCFLVLPYQLSNEICYIALCHHRIILTAPIHPRPINGRV